MTRPPLLAPYGLALSATVLLAACTNMSGLSGSSSFACKAPDGVTCDSVSGTYANAVQNNLPSQRPKPEAASSPAAAASAVPAARGSPPRAPVPALSPTTLRSSPRVLRLWFKPWEDADRDLYDQGYVYVQIDGGQWLIEHAQRRIREAYAPLRPPPRSAALANEPKDVAGAPPTAKGPARPPFGGDLLPGLMPPASRPDLRPDSTD